jgi:hypothetical protein
MELGAVFAMAVPDQRCRHSSLPATRAVAWLQRGRGTAGFTLAQKPYSLSWSFAQ